MPSPFSPFVRHSFRYCCRSTNCFVLLLSITAFFFVVLVLSRSSKRILYMLLRFSCLPLCSVLFESLFFLGTYSVLFTTVQMLLSFTHTIKHPPPRRVLFLLHVSVHVIPPRASILTLLPKQQPLRQIMRVHQNSFLLKRQFAMPRKQLRKRCLCYNHAYRRCYALVSRIIRARVSGHCRCVLTMPRYPRSAPASTLV